MMEWLQTKLADALRVQQELLEFRSNKLVMDAGEDSPLSKVVKRNEHDILIIKQLIELCNQNDR